jgi:Spy/CpxP family protein refolding chaperone
MNNILKSKWQVRVAVVVVFLLGFAAGILALNVYRGWVRAAGPGRGEDRFEQMSARLQLNADQKTKIQQVLADTREQLRALRKESEPRVSEIRKQTDQRVQQILTPDQWQRFQQMRDEMRARRGRDER